jgi:enoyl-CoA hydratase
MTDAVLYEVQGKIAYLTLNRPEARNAVNGDVAQTMERAIDQMESDPSVWVGILRANTTGQERPVFCAGADLKAINSGQAGALNTSKGGFGGFVYRDRKKPIIAAVDGLATAGGCELVLACDMVVAATDSVFVMAYSSVGLSPDGGGSWFLARAMPKALGNQFMLLGERIPAQRLLDAGLVNQLAPEGEVLSHALVLAQRLNERAPNALASIKELTESAYGHDLFTHLKAEKQQFLKNLNHANAQIGVEAFLNKQTPHYKP